MCCVSRALQGQAELFSSSSSSSSTGASQRLLVLVWFDRHFCLPVCRPLVLYFFLTEQYNKLVNTCTFPFEWSESVIFPVYKKGEVRCPNNYRGVSLLNVGGRLYSDILNKRLTQWTEDNKS